MVLFCRQSKLKGFIQFRKALLENHFNSIREEERAEFVLAGWSRECSRVDYQVVFLPLHELKCSELSVNSEDSDKRSQQCCVSRSQF